MIGRFSRASVPSTSLRCKELHSSPMTKMQETLMIKSSRRQLDVPVKKQVLGRTTTSMMRSRMEKLVLMTRVKTQRRVRTI